MDVGHMPNGAARRVAGPRLSTESVALRPLGTSDTESVYALAVLAPEQWLRMCEHGLPSPGEFEHRLWDGVLVQFAIVLPGGDVAGLMAVHGASFVHGTAWVDLQIDVGAATTVAEEALGLLLDYAFTTWPLRKVYARHASYQPAVFSSLDSVAVEEARLPDAIAHDGLYWDVIIESIRAESWRAVRGGGR